MLKNQAFRGDGSRNIELATHYGKTYIPKPLRKNFIICYYICLMHPDATSAVEKTKKHVYWPNLQRKVKAAIKNVILFHCLRRAITSLPIC